VSDLDPDAVAEIEPLDPARLRRVLAAAANALADALGVSADDRRRLAPHLLLLEHDDTGTTGHDPGTALAVDERRDPGALGRMHQGLLDAGHRHRRGVHYTPAPVAELLVERALGRVDDGPVPLVCDPSCGGGAFLLAAADHLHQAGSSPADAAAALHGIDVDPLAVEVTRTALVLWVAGTGVRGDELAAVAATVVDQVVEGDALHSTWPGEGHLDAVVGNPPFGGQLARSTARGRDASSAARELLGGSAAGYADTAGLFLVRAAAACAPGGRVVMLQPLSFLGTRDAGAVRRRLEEQAVLEEVWLADERLFGAAVDVCAPVLHVAGPLASPDPQGPVRVTRGSAAGVVEVPRDRLARAGTWAPIVAAATGVPALDLDGRPLLGSLARATAGFRDEFYALAPFVSDLADPDAPIDLGAPLPALPALPSGGARLVTSGLVEPARTVWGRRTTRLAGTRLRAPFVDVLRLRAWAEGPDGDRRLAAWADARLRPKVVVATQTRVVEAAVDDDGSWWPSVPVVSVVLDREHDDDEHRWLAAAALSAPPVSVWAAERSGGTARAPGALKLSARQVVEVPLPVDRDAWEEGARLLRLVADATGDVDRADRLLAAGRVLTEAHGLASEPAAEVLRWWAERAGCGPDIER
jgi:hypothetical protein